VELRRALLLFAIVLGLAAVATSVSRTPDRRDGAREPAASDPVADAAPGPAAPAQLEFAPEAKPPTEELDAGRAATVTVRVAQPGQVAIDGLGLSATADPLTPARFDVLSDDEGSYPLRLHPADGAEALIIGTLRIGPAAPGR
jgi:hypothetical protein